MIDFLVNLGIGIDSDATQQPFPCMFAIGIWELIHGSPSFPLAMANDGLVLIPSFFGSLGANTRKSLLGLRVRQMVIFP